MKDFSKEQVLEAIENTGGILSTVASNLAKVKNGRCSWSTARRYVMLWEETRAAIKDEEERMLDVSETTIMQSIIGGSVEDAKWHLSRKGRDRGYGKELVVRGVNSFDDLPFEDMKKWTWEQFKGLVKLDGRVNEESKEDEVFERIKKKRVG